jgi:hypothetical protein
MLTNVVSDSCILVLPCIKYTPCSTRQQYDEMKFRKFMQSRRLSKARQEMAREHKAGAQLFHNLHHFGLWEVAWRGISLSCTMVYLLPYAP